MAENYDTYESQLLSESTHSDEYSEHKEEKRDHIRPNGTVIRFHFVGRTIRVYRLTKPGVAPLADGAFHVSTVVEKE